MIVSGCSGYVDMAPARLSAYWTAAVSLTVILTVSAKTFRAELQVAQIVTVLQNEHGLHQNAHNQSLHVQKLPLFQKRPHIEAKNSHHSELLYHDKHYS